LLHFLSRKFIIKCLRRIIRIKQELSEVWIMSTRREMPVVLWVSEHEILPAESEELHRIFKNFIFLEYRKPIEAREELLSLIREVRPDVVIARAPLSIVAELLELSWEYGFEVWEEGMEDLRISGSQNCNEECEMAVPLGDGRYRIMRFGHFNRIREIRVVKEPVMGG
jgi:hypothetical protein